MKPSLPDGIFELIRLLKTTAATIVAALVVVSVFSAQTKSVDQRPENPAWKATPEDERRGRELLEKVIKAMGGGQKLDDLSSYEDIHRATVKLPQGDQQVSGRWFIEFNRNREGVRLPDRVREEVMADGTPGMRLTVRVYAPGNSFAIDQGRVYPMTEERRFEWMMSLQRHPLMLLRARSQLGFKVATAGKGQVDGRAAHLLFVDYDGSRMTLSIDAVRWRIQTVSFKDKDWFTGVPGQFVVHYSDYRPVDGLVLPFRHDHSFDDKLLLTGILESITLNQKLDSKLYEKP